MTEIVAQPLTAEAFAPYGDVLEIAGAPDKIINQGLCGRYHDRAALDFGPGGRAGISLFNAEPRSLLRRDAIPLLDGALELAAQGQRSTLYPKNPTLPRPGNCRRSGHTVSMTNRGPVTIECDRPGTSYARPSGPGPQVLQYGERWDIGGILCVSSRKGLECRNESGHGFFLSRAMQNAW